MKIRNKYDNSVIESPTLTEEKYFYRLINLGNCSILFKHDGWEEVKEESNEDWHDLRKNPNDVPSDDRYVLCCIKGYGCTGYTVDYYIADMDLGWAHLYDVIAWRELPKFKKGLL